MLPRHCYPHNFKSKNAAAAASTMPMMVTLASSYPAVPPLRSSFCDPLAGDFKDLMGLSQSQLCPRVQ